MAITVTNGLGGIGGSYATIADLQLLALPPDGDPAIIDGSPKITAPFNVTGLTLIVTVTDDGDINPVYTYTFPANYATLDLLAAAINIPKVQALNYSGRLRLRTTKVGIAQGLVLDHLSTANTLLGENIFFDSVANGRSSFTTDVAEDEMTFALVSASSLADGYLKRRYGLPLKQWSYDLIQAVCDIASYNIMKRQGFNPEVYDANWSNKYNAAIKWFEDVGNRREHPQIVDSGANPVPYAGTDGIRDDQRGWGNVIGSRGNFPGLPYGWVR